MAIPVQLMFIAPSAILMFTVIGMSLLDHLYDVDLSKQMKPEDGTLWLCFLIFVLIACIWRSFQARKLDKVGKITSIDVEFVAVHNAFSFVHLASIFGEFMMSEDLNKNALIICRLNVIGDWSLLLFLGWTVIWGRHVRRGWDLEHNLLIFSASLIGYLSITIHHTSFYFVLGVAVTLSCIALYETYKIHYYRNNVKQMFYCILIFTSCFYVLRLMAYVFRGQGWYLAYAYVVLFALMSSLTNRLYVQILKEVNEHKH